MSKTIIISGFIMLLLRYTSQNSVRVDNCPSNAQLWTQRANTFQCKISSEVYHCIQDIDHNLIEICMRAQNISSLKEGCPWVFIHNAKPYLGHPFNPCNSTSFGCPEKGHKKYRTNELYLYPACIMTGGKTTSYQTDSVTEKSKSTGTPAAFVEINPGLLIFVICLLASGWFCAAYLIYIHQCRERKHRKEDNRKCRCVFKNIRHKIYEKGMTDDFVNQERIASIEIHSDSRKDMI